jgi:hypothetical protein
LLDLVQVPRRYNHIPDHAQAKSMRRCVRCFLVYSWLIPISLSTASSQPTAEGHPHKWDTVEKGLADFIADGFELKSVIYRKPQG